MYEEERRTLDEAGVVLGVVLHTEDLNHEEIQGLRGAVDGDNGINGDLKGVSMKGWGRE